MDSNSVKIGIPELYDMIKRMDEANLRRDDDLKKLLLGNGQPGFAGRITKIEQIAISLKNELLAHRWVIGIILTLVVGISIRAML